MSLFVRFSFSRQMMASEPASSRGEQPSSTAAHEKLAGVLAYEPVAPHRLALHHLEELHGELASSDARFAQLLSCSLKLRGELDAMMLVPLATGSEARVAGQPAAEEALRRTRSAQPPPTQTWYPQEPPAQTWYPQEDALREMGARLTAEALLRGVLGTVEEEPEPAAAQERVLLAALAAAAERELSLRATVETVSAAAAEACEATVYLRDELARSLQDSRDELAALGDQRAAAAEAAAAATDEVTAATSEAAAAAAAQLAAAAVQHAGAVAELGATAAASLSTLRVALAQSEGREASLAAQLRRQAADATSRLAAATARGAACEGEA